MEFLLTWVLPTLILMLPMIWMMRYMQKKGGGGMFGMGKSNAKMYVENQTGKRFADVAGQDEAKGSPERNCRFSSLACKI